MDPTIERDLVSAFPPSTYAMTLRAVREGVILADDSLKSCRYLDAITGRDLLGHLRRAGIVFRMHELCVAGDLPFKSEMLKMPRAAMRFRNHIAEALEGRDEDATTANDN